jgi:hypothetical protein
MVVKLAAYGLCLILLALPSAVRSSENLVDKREACRVEARSRIVPKGKIKVDDYRRIVQRRAAYVTQCIGRTMVARSNAAPPPRRVLDDATVDGGQSAVASGVAKPRHSAGRPKPSRTKAAPVRTVKAAKSRGKAKPPFRRRK